MARQFLLNADRHQLRPVLKRVRLLHEAYKRGVGTDASARALNDLSSLLNHRAVTPILDTLLATANPDIALLSGQRQIRHDELQAEAYLAELFGFSPRQVRRHINRVCASGVDFPALAQMRLQTTGDLDGLINRCHSHLQDVAGATSSGWWESRQRNQKLKQDVDDAIFGIGAVVANALQTGYFRLSYSVAVATFRRLVMPDE
ncbi:hypothetical protein [Mycobacterium sp. 852002-50816_SCH5313054-b]|uniref:hypothetical protein n=1 Tax=Mycobacterium sp. 852002-50816_SCH5313054-b TaxID=1834092 RepID=UPI0012E9A202|nr:hypothetical protein [Mycobacterium sp. 852002-50816_SCH5313054-b]